MEIIVACLVTITICDNNKQSNVTDRQTYWINMMGGHRVRIMVRVRVSYIIIPGASLRS